MKIRPFGHLVLLKGYGFLRGKTDFCGKEARIMVNKKKGIGGQALVLPLLLGMLCACGHTTENQEKTVHTVVLVMPQAEGGRTVGTLSGVVCDAREVSLGFKTPGQLSRVLVREGDAVRKGQLVAVLDDADYRLGVEALQVQCEQLRREVGRMKQLYDSKSLSGNDYDKAVSGLRQLEVQLRTQQHKLDYTRLYAPADGIVRAVDFEPSEMVDAGTPVIVLMERGRQEVEVALPQQLYDRLDDLSDICCHSSALPGGRMPMRVSSVVPKADGSQLYQARLVFDGQPGGRLAAGMNVTVAYHLSDSTAQMRFLLPSHAVFQDKGETCVWTVDDDTVVHRTPVDVASLDGKGNAVVRAGLKGGERVVRAGVGMLRDGERVHVAGEVSETNVGGLL